METLHGMYVFTPGDRLTLREKNNLKSFLVVAVRQIKDSDCCFGCCFYMKCHEYPGNSPFAQGCYSTIFRRVDENKKRSVMKGKKYECR